MKKILAALLLVVSAFASAEIVTIPIPGAPGLNITVGTGANALPLQDIRTNPNSVNITTSDDWYTNVPLGFNFPMYGQTFSNSWAATNGFVAFRDPATTGLWGGCCSGVDLSKNPGSAYNYTIYGLHTDLYSWNGANQYYLRGTNEMTYGWYNISQCCSGQGGNSFEIKINSSGLIDTRIAGAMVSWNTVTSGFAGDLSKGEYYQYYHGQGLNIAAGAGVSWGAFNGTGNGADLCTTNPLSSPTCPGYQTAYTTQQCTISALWDPSCPGYQQAYFTQQCTLNPLYNSQCLGYQSAYLEQQCSINPLYSTSCSGYQQAYHDQQCSLNTLSYTDCPGYATAYLEQQCSINPLYSTTCSGYQQAYKNQQCSLNPLYATDCPGYAVAYKNQQCSLNALYATDCPGYAVAYKNQQCSLNALYATDCPGYQQAYFDQQCSLNSLYDKACPGYAEAYALRYIVAATATTTATTTTTTSTSSTTIAATPTTASDGTVSVPVVKDAAVNNVVTTTATSASPAQAATATVPLIQAPAATETKALVAVAVETKQEKTEEKKTNESSSASSTTTTASTGNTSSDAKSSDQPKSARQELQERRESAAKAKAVEAGKNLANEMGKAANMENQVQVQNVVIQAMGYSPAFEAYKVRMPDVPGYKPYSIYKNQTTVDNRRLSRGLFGATDNLHNSMVEQQYK